MEYHYYIGEGPEVNVLLTNMRKREEETYTARIELMKEYGADALIFASYIKGKPVGLGFKQEQPSRPFLRKGSNGYADGVAYYPNDRTKAGKELVTKLNAPELMFDASDYILKILDLQRMIVGRCAGSPSGTDVYYAVAKHYGNAILVKMPEGNDDVWGIPMPKIPVWLRGVKESDWLAAQGL